ncbi:MAG: tripartite tricarboxylate transporter permease, partial [Rhizobacter sp.]|nr:tripartite tricarboxylate transporter permease [Rhizobacter sp.]
MDLLHNLGIGFGVAFAPHNLLVALIGAVLGTLIGVLPGIGPAATIAMLLPVTTTLGATPALVMLAGVYYGAQYGGSTAAILINVPGESSSIATAIDGPQMARQGRAAVALAAATLGSFFAGCVGTAILAALAPPLTELVFNFGPAEYFSLMVLGLVGAVVLASGSLLKAIAMVVLGLLLAQLDADLTSATPRYGLAMPRLGHGVGLVVIAVGVFAFGEIIANLGRRAERREVFTDELAGVRPDRRDFVEAWPSVLRGTALGSLLGALPGGGALLASFASYALEKRLTREPRVAFGKGAIQGVAGPESANNAG